MIPGGNLGSHYAEHSMMGLSPGWTVVDDGTYINFAFSGTTYFRIRKSDNQFETKGGVTDSAF